MPPPRLIRPLRPCHSPRRASQTRWVSDGPRHNSYIQRGDTSDSKNSEGATSPLRNEGLDLSHSSPPADFNTPEQTEQTQTETRGQSPPKIRRHLSYKGTPFLRNALRTSRPSKEINRNRYERSSDPNADLRQQLQQLLDQAKQLQEQLGMRTSQPGHVSLEPLESTVDERATHPVNSTTTSTEKYERQCKFNRPALLLRDAQRRYQVSTNCLVITYRLLEELKSPRLTPIANKVNERLQLLQREANLEQDVGMRAILRNYSKRVIRKRKKMSNGKTVTIYVTPKDLGNELSTRGHVGVPLEEDSNPLTGVERAVSTSDLSRNQITRDLGVEAEKLQQSRKQNQVLKSTSPLLRTTLRHNVASPIEVRQSISSPTQSPVLYSGFLDSPSGTPVLDRVSPTTNSTNGETASQEQGSEMKPVRLYEHLVDSKSDSQRLTRQIHTQSRVMKSSDHSQITTQRISLANSESDQAPKLANRPSSSTPSPASSEEVSELSLLEELFPEASSYIQPHYHERRNSYPKLELPDSVPLIRRTPYDPPKSQRERVVESFQKNGEQITALQLVHCSTELTEADFRRLLPKGKHIESWIRDGEFYKVIPGRDPLSLERLPFYYLLFKSPESALAYQKNVARLHKLSQLHQPSNILSAIPPPKGFLEDGEDINLATSSYLLKPAGFQLNLNMVMQPYNSALRALIEHGGYKAVIASTSGNGKKIWKVLMHIEGYEPSPTDLYYVFLRHAYERGITWPFHTDSAAAIHRLRDIVDLRSKFLPISSANPRAASNVRVSLDHNDPSLSFLSPYVEGGEESAQTVNQMIMNRVYNRWIIDFEEEDAAKRFALMWHRKILPDASHGGSSGWKDVEEVRWCNCEFLW